jgi:hypothetical protein
MSTQAELVQVIQTESERLQQYLTYFASGRLTKPSACALWEVRDVVTHLIPTINGYTPITRHCREYLSLKVPRIKHLQNTLAGGTAAMGDGTRTTTYRELRHLATTCRPCSVKPGTNSIIFSSPSTRKLAQTCYHGRALSPRTLAHAGFFELAIHGTGYPLRTGAVRASLL